MTETNDIPYVKGFEQWQRLGYSAEDITALLITLTAPNELLDLPEFLRTEAESFSPFDYPSKDESKATHPKDALEDPNSGPSCTLDGHSLKILLPSVGVPRQEWTALLLWPFVS